MIWLLIAYAVGFVDGAKHGHRDAYSAFWRGFAKGWNR